MWDPCADGKPLLAELQITFDGLERIKAGVSHAAFELARVIGGRDPALTTLAQTGGVPIAQAGGRVTYTGKPDGVHTPSNPPKTQAIHEGQ